MLCVGVRISSLLSSVREGEREGGERVGIDHVCKLLPLWCDDLALLTLSFPGFTVRVKPRTMSPNHSNCPVL